MFSGLNRRKSKENSSAMQLGQIELEIDESYMADKSRMVARLDKESMKELHVSAGDAIIIFADEKPVIVKVFPLFPSDKSYGMIKLSKPVRNQLKREIGDIVTVRGIGNTKIDKVVNYLLFEELGKQD